MNKIITNITLTTILLLGYSTVFSQDTHWTLDGLSGAVKEVKHAHYSAEQQEDRWLQQASRGTYTTTYQENGLKESHSFKMTRGNFSYNNQEAFYYKDEQLSHSLFYDDLSKKPTFVKIGSESLSNLKSIKETSYKQFNLEKDLYRKAINEVTYIYQGDRIEKTISVEDESDTFRTETLFTYNSKNLISKVENISYVNNQVQERHTFEYEYLEFDSNGNWTKRISKGNQGYGSIEIRELEYYPEEDDLSAVTK